MSDDGQMLLWRGPDWRGPDPDVPGSADISPCGLFRYLLTRRWHGPGYTRPPLVVGMCNPSKADASRSDTTISQVMKFARREGHAGITVWNVYAFRATDPDHLWGRLQAGSDAVGPGNDEAIASTLAPGARVLVAWGALRPPTKSLRVIHDARIARVIGALRARAVDAVCLGVAQNGMPLHPLRRPDSTPFTPWPFPKETA